MSTFSEFWRKQRDRWDRRAIDRRHGLRRHLIHHVNRHGFEIGDYSIGAPKILFFDDGCRLTVGRFCSLAMGSTFVLGGSHRTEFVSTFAFGHMTGEAGPSDRTRSRGDVVIGSDVWIAANATILSGVTVGHGAVVGAGSVVIDDVPPYAVVLGNPARVISKRFSDDVIADLLELRWWDLEDAQVRALRPLLESADIGAFVDACRAVRGLPARAVRDAPLAAAPKAAAASGDLAAEIAAIIQATHPSFSPADMERPLKSLGIDSFTTLVIRARIEAAIGRAIDDGRWMAATTAGDIVRAIGTGGAAQSVASQPAAAVERRSYQLNMPQMALGGLSESWLFKELGDIHWRLIARGLGRPSHEIADVNGERLYATFTRFRLDSSAGLAAYRENERIELEAQASRYGAGLYFSQVTAAGEDRRLRAELMSSFAKVGEAASNASLLKGQPEIPPDCGIPAVGELPAFASAYRERRAAPLAAPLFECEYEIVPSHDINGVGLLYFAAYPTINDICAARYAGRSLTADYSTQVRDVFYFGNCDPDETLIFRLHRWDAADDRIEMEGSISRKSDGGLMAAIVTTKQAGAGYSAAQAGRPQS